MAYSFSIPFPSNMVSTVSIEGTECGPLKTTWFVLWMEVGANDAILVLACDSSHVLRVIDRVIDNPCAIFRRDRPTCLFVALALLVVLEMGCTARGQNDVLVELRRVASLPVLKVLAGRVYRTFLIPVHLRIA